MKISWLTLRDLEYLVAVAQHGHFGKAAAACHVSQPALSAQVKKVEELLATEVFERTNRRVTLTVTGRSVIDQARVVLDEAGKLLTLAQAQAPAMTGVLRLGAIATLGPYLLPHILKPLKAAFPKLDIRFKEGLTDGLLEDLRDGRLDAVLAARTFSDEGFTTYSIFEEPFVLMAPSGHPLAKKSSVQAKDFQASEMVLLEDGHCLRDQAIELCPSQKRVDIQEFHATSIETLRYLVANGAGYTLIPILAVRDDRQLRPLVKYRKIEGRGIGREIILVCRERYARKSDVETLAKFLGATCSQVCERPLAELRT